METKRIFFLITVILFLLTSSANASLWGDGVDTADLNDQRTFSSPYYSPSSSEGGLSGYWPYSFAIAWNVTQDANTMLWTYEYTLSATRKNVSHFILEVTNGATKDDFTNLSINGKRATFKKNIKAPKFWGAHPGNPGYPSATKIYGIKFDVGGNPVTYSFTTANDPVWGNFYAKGGKYKGKWIYAYNNALGMDDFNSSSKLDFIVRPDGGGNPPVVPEPISSLLFIVGGAVLAGRTYLKKSKSKKT